MTHLSIADVGIFSSTDCLSSSYNGHYISVTKNSNAAYIYHSRPGMMTQEGACHLSYSLSSFSLFL